MVELVCMLTQRYEAPSVKVRKRFVGILSVEIEGVYARKWNSEMVIVFQSVILQRTKGFNNSAQICIRILFRLNCWNHGAFEELVKDMYNYAMGYLRKDIWNKME